MIDLLPLVHQRVFTVGRLDRSSCGLLLVTNDGALAQQLTHPRYGVPKTDRVLVKGTRWRAATIELLGTRPISADLPRVFPSDHFGVACHLDLCASASGERS